MQDLVSPEVQGWEMKDGNFTPAITKEPARKNLITMQPASARNQNAVRIVTVTLQISPVQKHVFAWETRLAEIHMA